MDTTHDAAHQDQAMRDRDANQDQSPDVDPSDGWLTEAVRATDLDELRNAARRARAAGALTPRDQAWCRALAERLTDVDHAAMALLVRELVTGNGSAA